MSIQEIAIRYLHLVRQQAPDQQNAACLWNSRSCKYCQSMMLPWCCLLPTCMGGCKGCFPMAAASPHHISVCNETVCHRAQECCKGSPKFCQTENPGWQSCLQPMRLNEREAPDSFFLAALPQMWFHLLRSPGVVFSYFLYLCSHYSETLCHSTNWNTLVL